MADLFTLVGTISLDTKTALDNINTLIGKVEELEGKINGTQKDVGDTVSETAENVATNTSDTLSKWNVFLGNMATQAANKAYSMGKSFFQTGFEFNQNMEKWTASFKTYLGGDLTEAVALVEQLKQFAVDTPLSLEETMNQATKLLATGTAPEKLTSVLNMIGDLSQGNTELFSRISTAYWQAMSTGVLKAQDANQMTQAGVPIWQIMTDYYNAIGRDGFHEWTVGMTREVTSQASLPNSTVDPISSDEVNAALMMATSEGGMYFNAMNNLMDTEYGKAQKMPDAYTQAAGAFTKAIFDIFSSDTIPALNDILSQLNEWATENPDALKHLGEAFSELATGGVDLLLSSLTSLLEFWNTNQDMFNGMLMLFGGIAIKSGHIGAGLALITAGGYPVWNDWLEEQQKEFSALSSDVDLGFIRQQLEYQGKTDQWDAYLENWKATQRAAGYSDEVIEDYVATQLANYKPYTDDAMQATFEGYQGSEAYKNGGMGAWDAVTTLIDAATGGEKVESDIPTELQYLQFRRQRDIILDTTEDGTSGSSSIPALIGAIQSLTASVQNMTSDVPSAISEGIGGITVTGTITTGNVTLDGGAIVGELAPQFDLKLGSAGKLADRG